MKKKVLKFRRKFKKASPRLRMLLTALFIAICAMAVVLVVVTIDEKPEDTIRTVAHEIPLENLHVAADN